MQCRSSPILSLIPLWVPSQWKIQFDPECLREFSNLIYILRFKDGKSTWSIHIDSVGTFSRLIAEDGRLSESPRTDLKAPVLPQPGVEQTDSTPNPRRESMYFSSASSNSSCPTGTCALNSGVYFFLKFENGILNINGTGFSIPFDESLIEMEWDLSQVQNRIEEPIPRKKLRTVCLNMICSQVQLNNPIADYKPREFYFKADVTQPGTVRVLFLSEKGEVQTLTREIKNWPFQPEKGYHLKVYPLEKKVEMLNKTHPLMMNDTFGVRIEVIQ